jgi:hypothetical protein
VTASPVQRVAGLGQVPGAAGGDVAKLLQHQRLAQGRGRQVVPRQPAFREAGICSSVQTLDKWVVASTVMLLCTASAWQNSHRQNMYPGMLAAFSIRAAVFDDHALQIAPAHCPRTAAPYSSAQLLGHMWMTAKPMDAIAWCALKSCPVL